MFSRILLSNALNIGKSIFVNDPNLRLFPQKFNTSFLYTPLAGLKSHDAIQLPEKPKKPSTPFFRFIKEHRLILLKGHPDMKVTEVVKKCSENWKKIDPSLKTRYETEYQAELEVYAKHYLDYSRKLTDEQRAYMKEMNLKRRESLKKRRMRSKLRRLNKPKKPVSPFIMYLMDQAKIQNRKYNELMTELKSTWHNLDKTEKAKYLEKGEQAKALYAKELEHWETKMLKEGHLDVVRVKTLNEKRPETHRQAKKTSSQRQKKGDVDLLKEKKTGMKEHVSTKKTKTSSGRHITEE